VLAWVAANHAAACRERGFDIADKDQLEKCAVSMPETEARFKTAVDAALAVERRRQRAALEAITRDELIGPVCRGYAARP
jgi:hypothetical protein